MVNFKRRFLRVKRNLKTTKLEAKKLIEAQSFLVRCILTLDHASVDMALENPYAVHEKNNYAEEVIDYMKLKLAHEALIMDDDYMRDLKGFFDQVTDKILHIKSQKEKKHLTEQLEQNQISEPTPTRKRRF